MRLSRPADWLAGALGRGSVHLNGVDRPQSGVLLVPIMAPGDARHNWVRFANVARPDASLARLASELVLRGANAMSRINQLKTVLRQHFADKVGHTSRSHVPPWSRKRSFAPIE